jgi:hypothetical protein
VFGVWCLVFDARWYIDAAYDKRRATGGEVERRRKDGERLGLGLGLGVLAQLLVQPVTSKERRRQNLVSYLSPNRKRQASCRISISISCKTAQDSLPQ